MPNKIKAKSAASKARKRAAGRNTGRERIFRPGRKKKAPSAVVGNSIFTVSFPERVGSEIFFNLQPEPLERERFDKIFHDCWKAYANLHYLVLKERISLDLQKIGLGSPASFSYILTSFKKLIPRNFEFNIEEENGDYFFTIFKYCAGWERAWHCMEVGPALLYLKEENKALHDLFLIFLKVFISNTGVDLWDNGLMGNTISYLDDNVLNMEEEQLEEADIQAYRKDIEKYNSGISSEYAQKINKAPKMHPLEIQKRAYRFKKCGQISNLIFQGCELLLFKYNLHEFDYHETTEEEEGYYLDFESQANVIWSYEDNLFREHEMILDSLAQEGVQEPCFSFKIDGSIRKIDFQKMEEKSEWPTKLSGYFSRAFQLINEFKNERDNSKISKIL